MARQDTFLILGAVTVLGFVLYKAFNVGKKAVDYTAQKIADLWLKMFPLPPAMQLLGEVKFPGNLRVPIQQLHNEGAIRQDRQTGRTFVKYAGYFWELSPQVNGLWPATRVE